MTANAKSATTVYSIFRHQLYTLTSGQTVYQGDGAGLVASTGKVVKWASGRTDLTFVGVFEEDYVATADISVRVDRLRDVPAVKFANDTGTALALAGATAYMLDSATVTGDSTSNSVAGTVVQVDTDGVWVEVLPGVGTSTTVRSLVAGTAITFASHDATPTVATLISGKVFTVPTDSAAATVTLPTAGSPVAGTIVYFQYDGSGTGANTITYRQGTTALSADLAGDKRHLAIAVFANGVWAVNAVAAP